MNYAYYPGCSLTAAAKEYDTSTRAVLAALGVKVNEIPDWTCCGASAAEGVDQVLALALAGRNLALSARELPGLDILAPCSACYLNLMHVSHRLDGNPALAQQVEELLAVDGLSLEAFFELKSRPRHLLDVLSTDLADALEDKITHPLKDMVIAPYYGCQALRPYPVFDDPERPTSMDPILRAMGAEPLAWDKGGHCCGASLTATSPKVAAKRVDAIFDQMGPAWAIATVCPMCQMGLEARAGAYESKTGHEPINVLYLPQLMGLAMGLDQQELRLDGNIALDSGFAAAALERA